MSGFRAKLAQLIDIEGRIAPTWIPAPFRALVRQLMGEDPAAQLLRGLFWRYRSFVILALATNIGVAFFEGSTMAVFTLALQALGGQGSTEGVTGLGFTGALINRLGLSPDTMFLPLIGLAVVTQLLRSGMQYANGVVTAYLVAWLEGDLRRRMFRQFVSVSYPQISRYKTGDLVSYTEQITPVGTMVLNINRLVSDLLVVIAYVVVLMWLSWQMTLAALVALLIFSGALRQVFARLRQIAQRFVNATVSFNTQLIEFLNGLRTVHAFGREQFAIARVDAAIDDGVQARRMSGVRWAAIAPLYHSLTVIGVATFLLFGYQWMQGAPDAIPRLVTFVVVLYRLLPFVTIINNNIAAIYDTLPAVTRVADILRADDKTYPTSGSVPVKRIIRELELQHVTLCYPDSGRAALQDLTLTIPCGSVTAFVGASGAGKSSLVNLLLRLYDPSSGQILADGQDIAAFDLTEWRGRLGVVDQDTFIFHSSVRENILFGRLEASEDDIVIAAKMAHAHEFITELTDGYSTVVGDRGYRLSGGQRQRIAIARAVLRDPDILILDEATSALDTQSELLIQAALDHLRRDRTILVIAHRLSTVVRADRIVVLDEGRIVEQGTHSELLALGGRYAALWYSQSKSDA